MHTLKEVDLFHLHHTLFLLSRMLYFFKDQQMTDSEICKLACELELKFNPYCRYQDPYGCGMGGFKRMEFFRDGSIKYEYLPTELFEKYDMCTGIYWCN